MKYKYIVITEDCHFYGTNELTSEMGQDVKHGVLDIIDCEHGESLSNFEANEWESLEEYK